MNENRNEQMTGEQLERFAKLYSRCQELNPVFALARQGLQLRTTSNQKCEHCNELQEQNA